MQLRFTSGVGCRFLQILLGRKRRQLLYLLHYVSAVLNKLRDGRGGGISLRVETGVE